MSPYGFWSPLIGSTVDPMVVIVPAVDSVVRMEEETVTTGVVTDALPPVPVQFNV